MELQMKCKSKSATHSSLPFLVSREHVDIQLNWKVGALKWLEGNLTSWYIMPLFLFLLNEAAVFLHLLKGSMFLNTTTMQIKHYLCTVIQNWIDHSYLSVEF